jgi:hypothetical protein
MMRRKSLKCKKKTKEFFSFSFLFVLEMRVFPLFTHFEREWIFPFCSFFNNIISLFRSFSGIEKTGNVVEKKEEKIESTFISNSTAVSVYARPQIHNGLKLPQK